MSILTIHAPFLHKKLCKKAIYIKQKMQFHAKSANDQQISFHPFFKPVSSLFLRRYSIVTPYQLHSKSIVSMEKRWSIDGRAMQEHKNILGIYPKNTQRKILSFIFIHKQHIHSFLQTFIMILIDIYEISLLTQHPSMQTYFLFPAKTTCSGRLLSVSSI